MIKENDPTEYIGDDASIDLKQVDEAGREWYNKRDEIFDEHLKQLNKERPRIYSLGKWLVIILSLLIITSVIISLFYVYDRYVHIVFISAGFILIATIMASLLHGVNHKGNSTNTDKKDFLKQIPSVLSKRPDE